MNQVGVIWLRRKKIILYNWRVMAIRYVRKRTRRANQHRQHLRRSSWRHCLRRVRCPSSVARGRPVRRCRRRRNRRKRPPTPLDLRRRQRPTASGGAFSKNGRGYFMWGGSSSSCSRSSAQDLSYRSSSPWSSSATFKRTVTATSALATCSPGSSKYLTIKGEPTIKKIELKSSRKVDLWNLWIFQCMCWSFMTS